MLRRLLPLLLLTPLLWLARDHAPPLLQPECADAACKTTSTTTTTEATTTTTTATTTTTTTTTLAGALIKDLFERAAPLGDNWTTLTGYGALTIYNSSDASCVSCSTDDNIAYWDTDTLTSAASYACVLLKNGTNDADGIPGACITDPVSNDAVCCTAQLKSSGQVYALSQFNDGTFDSDLAGPTAQAWATGDAIGIVRIDADTARCYRQASGGTTWAALSNETDFTVTISASSFNAGMTFWSQQTDTTEAALDAMEAFEADDTTTLPTGAACGSN